VARSCGETDPQLTQEQAVEVARAQVAWEPTDVQVRLLKRGLRSQPYWAVSLSEEGPDGTILHCLAVRVDATTGEAERVPC
jgi:hypothetical protein